ncbi:selenide, water dikinase SelD [Flavihumibacter rivuli]|uniref:selenide, water dikinase SelD n=1 Tax=Flavihumibacter rivuli TaxID=2838156 RepID=UPI001BDF09F5|nr:selenide, water dikinase SelD [Flavihumibacter rivuli]ULQ55723.1 selenide, water dikinase SelD [Flavihumibacter rivuli]
MSEQTIRLTQFSHGAGCGCKIAPQVLEQIVHTTSPMAVNPKLLVGNESKDDAAVYDMGNGSALITTTDFFMPIVDDPFDFGRIAAANAISDVYAMGGDPIVAIAILGWPVEKLPADIAARVLEGGRAICAEAGIPLAGGHSIDSPEPIFGLSVNGLVDIRNLKQNNTAREGDLLFITKPLGVGVLSTAQKRGELLPEHYDAMVKQLTTLNKIGASLGNIPGVTAMTDITGFGLMGHLIEMAEGSGLTAQLFYNSIPVLEGVRDYLAKRIVPDATYRNWNSYSNKVAFEKGVNVMEAFSLLPDPQTNGGLLFSVSPNAMDEVVGLLQSKGMDKFIEPIGKLEEKGEKLVRVSA